MLKIKRVINEVKLLKILLKIHTFFFIFSITTIRVRKYVPSFILRSWKRPGAKDLNGCSPRYIEGERERERIKQIEEVEED